MLKKTLLAVASFALICVAFAIYQWQDGTPPQMRLPNPPAPVHPLPARAPQTAPAGSQPASFMFRGAEIPPGESPMVRVFDEHGEARIVFKATKWRPLSDTEFELTEPRARLLLPGGQLAFVRADQGYVVVQRDDNNNYNPKRGKLTGHVQIFVDKTKPNWRKAHPDEAEPEGHPEAIVKIWMDDAEFDLDLAWLHTPGPILVQSVDTAMEGRGLTLVWNEFNRRIKLLKIEQGKRAWVRMKGLVQFGMTGQTQMAQLEPGQSATPSAASAPIAAPQAPQQTADESAAVTHDRTKVASDVHRTPQQPSAISLFDVDAKDDNPRKDRVDTYHIVFKEAITVEQKQGIRVLSRLCADTLEMVRDFGERERSAVENVPGTRPAPADANTPSSSSPSEATVEKEIAAPSGKDSTIVIDWTGELVVTPIEPRPDETPPTGERFHVTAIGNPVQIHDKDNGDFTCTTLEYHDETQEVLLTGTAANPVHLQTGPHRVITGEKIALDRKKGIASVEGPGSMADRRVKGEQADWPDCMKEGAAQVTARHYGRAALKRPAAEEQGPQEMLATWTGGVHIEFGNHPFTMQDPATGQAIIKTREYLKQATFTGNVHFEQPGQAMSADTLHIDFAEPADADLLASAPDTSGKGNLMDTRDVVARTMLAEGHVHMRNDRSTIACDRLEVDMTVDDTGDNVPKVGRAYGHVVATQDTQEIRADRQITVLLESVPKPVTDLEHECFEAGAKNCGYTTESPEWKLFEEKLKQRRQIVLVELEAVGNVVVNDPQEQLDLAADTLHSWLDQDQRISRTTIVSSDQQPGHVTTRDFYIRGPQINFDVVNETVDVPGEGVMRFFTRQDIDGRRMDEAVPVVVTWKTDMAFRGKENTGQFRGAVQTVSQNTVLDCREMTLRFDNLAPPATQTTPAGSGEGWIASRMLEMVRDRNRPNESDASAAGVARQMRKRLTHVQALGDAVIASSEYERSAAHGGPFKSLLTNILPEAVLAFSPTSQPNPADQRLLSFVRVNGPRITINLLNEQMVVEGAGNLLALDYRLPDPASASPPRNGDLASQTAVASFRSGGPSQTVFTWQNFMSYLNERNVAVLDSQVVMKHAAGSEVAIPQQVAAAMKIDPRRLAQSKGRRAELTCDNLVVEFKRDPAGRMGRSAALSGATQLKAIQASHRVRMQENNRSVEGEIINYSDETGMLKVQGSAALPAWIADIDPKTGALRASYRSSELEWDLKTGVITSTGTSILAPGR